MGCHCLPVWLQSVGVNLFNIRSDVLYQNRILFATPTLTLSLNHVRVLLASCDPLRISTTPATKLVIVGDCFSTLQPHKSQHFPNAQENAVPVFVWDFAGKSVVPRYSSHCSTFCFSFVVCESVLYHNLCGYVKSSCCPFSNCRGHAS